jgi:alcohol dehydrogenase class IV
LTSLRGSTRVVTLTGPRTERVVAAIEALARSLGTPAFRDLGIPREDLPWVARRAAENGSNPSNPRPMGPPEYLELLEGLS